MERELPLLYLDQDDLMVKLTDGREMTLAEYEAMVDFGEQQEEWPVEDIIEDIVRAEYEQF